MNYKSHYDYLDVHLPTFLLLLIDRTEDFGLVGAHGDKCYGYKPIWDDAGICFNHGCLIYLLSYLYPYNETVRRVREYTEDRQIIDTWVDPCTWVIKMYHELLPTILEAEREVNLYNERKKS